MRWRCRVLVTNAIEPLHGGPDEPNFGVSTLIR